MEGFIGNGDDQLLGFEKDKEVHKKNDQCQ